MQTYIVKVFDNKTEWRNSEDQLHREDGPAIEYANGDKLWYKNGKFHREDGPAIEWASGTKLWYKNGQLHREDGPAFEYPNGNKLCYKNGKLHRENGPAVEYINGHKEWWLDGKELTKEEWQRQLNNPSCDGKIVEIEGKKYQLKEI